MKMKQQLSDFMAEEIYSIEISFENDEQSVFCRRNRKL